MDPSVYLGFPGRKLCQEESKKKPGGRIIRLFTFDISDEVMIMIYVDVACDEQQQVSSSGVVMCNSHGDMVAAMHGYRPMLVSPLCVGSYAILEGLQLEYRLKIQEIHLCSDSFSLILMLRDSKSRIVETLSNLWDIEDFNGRFQEVKFTYINRDQNGIVHKLARMGLVSTPTL